jgi:translation initiation factor IF-2
VTTADLANLMRVTASDIIMKCMSLGLMVSINQRLDKDTITLIASDYGFEVEFLDDQAEQEVQDDEDAPETLQPRSPIVTIMGHVDHGKTSLLDYIRNANVVAGEAGGITQHIGAYRVETPSGRKISFLDTPGHEAFTAMRARGAQVTDIVVLVVSADDSVMPQTIEAISHAQAANVPIVVAINKIDRPDANPDRIRQQLADHGVLVEDWGGKFQVAEISAKLGTNVPQLLEKILLEADLLELKANPDRAARAAVIEAHVDKGRGNVVTVIVQKGTLNVGDIFVCGQFAGRVRAMFDERGQRMESAGPSMPAQVTGFDGLPNAGDILMEMESDAEAREVATRRQQLRREQQFRGMRHMTLDDISAQIQQGGVKELRLIVRADVSGSVEALSDSLQKLSTAEVKVRIIFKAVGAITESDIMLASASDAVIVGFQVNTSPAARKVAEAENVDVRLYSIIYDCINEVQLALEGMLTPDIKEEITSSVEVRAIFKISKLGTIAGCYVQTGKITRNDKVRVLRDGFEIYKGTLASLKRIKDDVREVDAGYECGIGLQSYNDLEVGDIIEGYKTIEVKRKLS